MQNLKNLRKTYSQVFISSMDYDSKNIYSLRRQRFMKKLDSFCVFAGMQIDPGSEEPFTETWTRFVQDPAFLYLTGVNQAGCFLVFDPRKKEETLFVPNKDPFKEFWIGKRLGFEKKNKEISLLTGIKNIRPASELWPYLQALAKKYEKFLKKDLFAYAYFYKKIEGDHNKKFKTLMQRKLKNFNIKSCADLHFEDRLPLDIERIKEAKKAQEITDKAFRNLLTQLKHLKTEREVSLFLNYEMQKQSDGDLAFPTIAACGENACCLHYVKNDEKLQQNKMILLDFGIRYGTLHSDISRTIPITGKYNPLQKLLYEIVLDSSKYYQKFVRPGVTLKDIGQIPWDFIIESLEENLVKKLNGSYKLSYDKKPHGVSHFIGECIHEGNPETRSMDVVLCPGMLISCEPGLYGEFSAIIKGKKYCEKMGIRIEDDLLITKNGYTNISKNIPREVKDIENLLK